MKQFLTDVKGLEVVMSDGDVLGTLQDLVVDTESAHLVTALVRPKYGADRFVRPDENGLLHVPVRVIRIVQRQVVVDSAAPREKRKPGRGPASARAPARTRNKKRGRRP